MPGLDSCPAPWSQDARLALGIAGRGFDGDVDANTEGIESNMAWFYLSDRVKWIISVFVSYAGHNHNHSPHFCVHWYLDANYKDGSTQVSAHVNIDWVSSETCLDRPKACLT